MPFRPGQLIRLTSHTTASWFFVDDAILGNIVQLTPEQVVMYLGDVPDSGPHGAWPYYFMALVGEKIHVIPKNTLPKFVKVENDV